MSNFPRKNFPSGAQERDKKKKSAIISSAFQDHIIKQLDLSCINPSRNIIKVKTAPKTEIKSKINTGLKIPLNKKSKEDNEDEFIINEDHKPTTKTLAEKIGLVPTTKDDKLNETEWGEVKQKYIEREEFKEPCVICKEALGAHQQVLLSCSHTFHRKCLEAFEKFSGRKTCPMCRKDRYHKRVIYDASKHYKHECAAKIQGAWRGYIVRKWYKNYRKTTPPNNPALRKIYFEEKLSDITNRLVQTFNYESQDLCNDIDRNIKESREMLKNFENRMKVIDEEKWSYLMKKAILRNNAECSICINKLDIPEDLVSKLEDNNKATLKDLFQESPVECKPISLLSCSHIFHHTCLQTFEELNFDRLHCCPECRSAYQKYDLKCNFRQAFLTQALDFS